MQSENEITVPITPKIITPKIITELKEKIDKCNICCSKMITGETIVKLLCKHYYHYECILENYRNSTTMVRECPYCRSNGGWLPLLQNTKPELHIHQEYCSKVQDKKLKCPAKLVSGYNKGNKCGNSGYKSYNGFCGTHKKQGTSTII
tara:strand:+ start:162 stop:605 length:444 start_codon:yes stop_codon:yes gene_type:complete